MAVSNTCHSTLSASHCYGNFLTYNVHTMLNSKAL